MRVAIEKADRDTKQLKGKMVQTSTALAAAEAEVKKYEAEFRALDLKFKVSYITTIETSCYNKN